jgi:hypothetical protein
MSVCLFGVYCCILVPARQLEFKLLCAVLACCCSSPSQELWHASCRHSHPILSYVLPYTWKRYPGNTCDTLLNSVWYTAYCCVNGQRTIAAGCADGQVWIALA